MVSRKFAYEISLVFSPGSSSFFGSRRFVAEDAVEFDVFQLTLGILVKTTEPDVADALTDHTLTCEERQGRVYDLDADMSIKPENDPILTLFRATPYIRIGYTPDRHPSLNALYIIIRILSSEAVLEISAKICSN